MDFAAARRHMVENQLMPNNVTAKEVRERFLNVPREFFVQPSDVALTYSDGFVSIGKGRKMLPPMVEARLIQELDIQMESKVLILAAGSGYSAIVVAPLCKEVWSVEEEKPLCDVGRKAAVTGQCNNINVMEGRPEGGLKKEAPFDRILIDAPVGFIPDEIFSQLASGGKLMAIVENEHGVLEARRYTKSGKTVVEESLFDTKGEILSNFTKEEKFVF